MYLDDPLTGKRKTFVRRVPTRSPSGAVITVEVGPRLTFDQLKNDELLDTQSLCYLFDCSQRTLYRWIVDRGLKPWRKLGGELLFRKGDVVAWYKAQQP